MKGRIICESVTYFQNSLKPNEFYLMSCNNGRVYFEKVYFLLLKKKNPTWVTERFCFLVEVSE